MTTNLLQETERATNPIFQATVRAAVYRLIPDIVGEVVGGALTEPRVAKRHAWAIDFQRQPDFWVPKVAGMLAGESLIRAVDVPAIPPDASINARLLLLIDDLAGVRATD